MANHLFLMLTTLLTFLPHLVRSQTDPHDQAVLTGFYSSLKNLGVWNQTWNGLSDACSVNSTWIACSGSSPNLKISKIALSNFELLGTIPTQFGTLTQLTSLDLSSNLLSGSIPTELSLLTDLVSLRLGFNILSGTIPSQLGNLKNLNRLFLNSNQLTGTIPAELSSCTNLATLWLYGNHLEGTVPPQFGNLSKLSVMRLHFNQLIGTIPTELGNLKDISQIYLNHNTLTGTIPTELGTLSKLQILYLNQNCFSEVLNYEGWSKGDSDYSFYQNSTECENSVPVPTSQPVAPKCPAQISGNATWGMTTAGSKVSGTCLEGYTGSPTRSCQQTGSLASWLPVENPCTPTTPASPSNSTGAIVGGVIGGVVCIGILVVVVFFIFKRRNPSNTHVQF